MIKLNPAVKMPWTSRSSGSKSSAGVMDRPYAARTTARIGSAARKVIKFDSVLMSERLAGEKLGCRTRSRLLINRPQAELRELLNHPHGRSAQNTKAG